MNTPKARRIETFPRRREPKDAVARTGIKHGLGRSARGALCLFLGVSLTAWGDTGTKQDRVPRGEGEAVALPPGMHTGHRLTDRAFFSELDLSLDGFEDVQRCVSAENWGAARDALYVYVHDKFRAADYIPSRIHRVMRRRVGDRWLARARDFVVSGKYVFQSTGREYRFNPDRPFDFMDFDPRRRPLHEPLELYALYPLFMLRDAWLATGETLYVRRAEALVANYCRHYGGGAGGPRGAHDKRHSYLHPWANWTLPRRLRAFLAFFSLLKNADLDREIVVEALKVLYDEQRLHVERGRFWGGNWRQFMCTDAGAVTITFFEFEEAGPWYHQQVSSLLKGANDLMPDGTQLDLSTSYIEGYLTWLREFSDLIQAFDRPMRLKIPAEAAARYEACIDWQLAMRKPDGTAVQFNDTGHNESPAWYGALAGDVFGYFGRDDLLWWDTEGAKGSPPANPSFPRTSTDPCHAGMYVMRGDWSDKALYLAVDFGPYGTSHGHPDYGSFVLQAFGQDLVVDGGCASYSSPAHRFYSEKPWAHSIVSVDDVTQGREGRPRWGRKRPLSNWITNPAFDFAWGRYPFAAVDEKLGGVVHRRAVYFAKPDYYLVLDRIEGKGRHRVSSRLQLASDVSLSLDGNGAHVSGQTGAALDVIALDARAKPSVVKERKKPRWEGWTSRVPHSNSVTAAPAVVYEESLELPVSFQTLLYPVPNGVTPAVRTRYVYARGQGPGTGAASAGRQQAVLLDVSPRGAPYTDTLVVSWTNAQVGFPEHGLSFAGRLLHLRRRADFLHRIAFISATAIRLGARDGGAVIGLDEPGDGYIDLGTSGLMEDGKIYLDPSNRCPAIRVCVTLAGGKVQDMKAPVGRVLPFAMCNQHPPE